MLNIMLNEFSGQIGLSCQNFEKIEFKCAKKYLAIFISRL